MVNGRAFVQAAAAISFAALIAGCAESPATPVGIEKATAERSSSSAYHVLYSFGTSPTDGVNPQSRLIALHGVLYGTTTGGGSGCSPSGGCGTVFAMTTAGAESVLHSFAGGTDGALPYAALLSENGVLYGTTGGGASTNGTVFSVTTSGVEAVLHDFGEAPDGADPHAALLAVNGTLYGTTVFGGSLRRGTIYVVSPSGKESVLYSFQGTRHGHRDGKYPNAGLIDVHGTLYGTTYKGGDIDRGTVYKIDPSGAETILHSFSGGRSDGAYPRAGLVYAGGALYGTTSGGGNLGCGGCGKNPGQGTVFRITRSGTETILHEFNGYPSDGAFPYGALVYVHGLFYGTTQLGGSRCAVDYGCGTIFSLTPAGEEKVLYNFLPRNGSFPVAGLTELNGTLYGATPYGGVYNQGTVFSLSVTKDPK